MLFFSDYAFLQWYRKFQYVQAFVSATNIIVRMLFHQIWLLIIIIQLTLHQIRKKILDIIISEIIIYAFYTPTHGKECVRC